MAAPRLKIGGLDLSEFLRTQPDESPAADPAGSGYFRPQFSGAAALGEGSTWVGNAVDNRQMVFPLYFTGATRAVIKLKIEEVHEMLVKGAQVEFCIDPTVESSSFFDLESGILEEQFNFYHLINTIAGAVLTLTVRPYANTATHRLIASIPAATSAVVMFPATGIVGDTYALANLEVRVGSQVASAGRVIAWGMHPNPSHRAYQAATSGLAQTGATVRGASGAIGSQYTAIPVSPTGASGIAYTAYLEPVAAHVGRHRVIAVGRSALNMPIPLYAEDRFGAILGATALASQTDVNKWQVIDLGEVQVPARASGQDTTPTQYVALYGGGASGAEINASPAFHLNGIMFLPLDYSAGIMRTPNAGAGGEFIQDTFSRYLTEAGELRRLDSAPNSDSNHVWTKATGSFGIVQFQKGQGGITAVSGATPYMATGASAFYDIASGVQLTDVAAQCEIFPPASKFASGAYMELWAKRQPGLASAGLWSRLTLGPSQTLQLFSGNGTNATMIGSAGIASTLASGLFQQGIKHTLYVRTLAGAADVYLATGALGASPILHASNAAIGIPGNPALRQQYGGQEGNSSWSLDALIVQAVGATSPGIGAREYFRFESHPEGRVYQGNASAFTADRLANYRGQFPKLPPVGSPAASGPAIIAVLQGEVDSIVGNDGADISVSVLERWRFLG